MRLDIMVALGACVAVAVNAGCNVLLGLESPAASDATIDGPPAPADGSRHDAAAEDAAAIDALDETPDAAPAATLVANRTDYSFGPIVIGADSATAELRISNVGELVTGPLDPAVLDGAMAGEFRLVSDQCNGRVLNPDEDCALTVRFHPSALGEAEATVRTAASPGGAVTITLRGTGAAAGALAISPVDFAFPAPIDAGQGTTQVFTVINRGGVNTSALVTPTIVGDASLTILAEDCTGRIVTPSGGAVPSCTITVRFAPTRYGTRAATLSASAAVGGSAQTTVAGTGRETFTLTVTNPGGGTVTSTPVGDINCGATCSRAYAVTTTPPSVSLMAQAAAGLSFGTFRGDCSGSSCSVVMSQHHAVTAEFTAPLAVTIAFVNDGRGTVAATTPSGFSCSTNTCTTSYPYGTEVTLRATPTSWSLFDGWAGACTNTSGDCLVTMTAARSTTAAFRYNCDPGPTGAILFVDNVLGTDDAVHGAGLGVCAVKTFSYARSRISSTGKITLSGERPYSPGAGGEGASPWRLSNAQSLECSGNASITWSATDGMSSSNYLLLIDGTNTNLAGCVFDGQGRPGGGVRVTGSGTDISHMNFIQVTTFTAIGGNGVLVDPNVQYVRIQQSQFQSTTTGVRWTTGNIGSVGTTTFSGSSTVDITCGNASPNVTGGPNSRTGGVRCTVCSGCPF